MLPTGKWIRPDIAAATREAARRVEQLEIALVRHQVRFAARRYVREVAIVVNHLGNGWCYPFVAIALWYSPFPRARVTLAAAVLAATIGHCIYPWLKQRVARNRPCEAYPELCSLLKPLDKYSLPSGHCMTLTTVSVPIVITFPATVWCACVAWALLGWARIASAHHYPTDVVAGMVLGATVAWPVCRVLLS
jgi:undecaprenyl-diphosphatase